LLLLQARKYLTAHSTGRVTARAMMGRCKKRGKPVSPSNKLVQEPEENEENRYSDPDSNKMKINCAKNPMKPTRTN
jgi:hypothetical protein